GAADPTKIFVKPLFESVPVHLTMDASDFSATYKAPAVSGANTTDPFWGWPATVSVSGSVVTVTNSPTPGQIVHPYGAWEARVDSIDDGADGGVGTITVHHRLDATSVDRVGFRNGNAVLFTVTAVDLAAITYTYQPETIDPVGWAAILLAVAVAGDLLGTSLLYAAVRRLLIQDRHMPRWLESGMRRWTEFLVVRDERVILLNRVAPVVPFVGAFIAALRWSYPRSMAFVAVGGLAKYAALLYLVFVIGVSYDIHTARTITLVLVVVVIALSLGGSWWYRRRRVRSAGKS